MLVKTIEEHFDQVSYEIIKDSLIINFAKVKDIDCIKDQFNISTNSGILLI